MDNKLPKILSFSGRKHSGKTELAKLCAKYNYENINFADSLKDLICNSLEITREYLENNKDERSKQKYNLLAKVTYISHEINIDEEIVRTFLMEPFDSIRNILQIIGTNLIRKYNCLWHINKIKEKIKRNPDKYYCIGDTRFIDEKKLIDELEGECWFIIRPNMFEISNHYSEVELKWNNFGNNIIINNTNKENFTKKWENYLQSMKYSKLNTRLFNTFNKKELRDILISLLKKYNLTEISNISRYSVHNIVYWCKKLMIATDSLKYDPSTFLEPTSTSSYVMGILSGDGHIQQRDTHCSIMLKSTEKYIIEMFRKEVVLNESLCLIAKQNKMLSFACDNPFIIENIKLWNFNPGSNQQIPFLLENNIEMLKYWIVGLIDAQGSILLHDNSLILSILSSKNVIEHLHHILPYGNLCKHNSYDNLFVLNFSNHNCLAFYEWLGEKAFRLGLRKKWSIIVKYKSLDANVNVNGKVA